MSMLTLAIKLREEEELQRERKFSAFSRRAKPSKGIAKLVQVMKGRKKTEQEIIFPPVKHRWAVTQTLNNTDTKHLHITDTHKN